MNEFSSDNQPQHQFLLRKASIGHRIGAFLIDAFIFYCIFIFLFFILGIIMAMSSSQNADYYNEASGVFYIFVFLAAFIILLFMYSLRDSIKGQSIGKRMVGIGVRDVSDNFKVPSVSKLFFRQIFTFVLLIEFFVLVFSDDNRKLGDRIVGAGVYNLREYEEFVLYNKRMQYLNQGANIEQLQNINPYIRKAEPAKLRKSKLAMIVVGVMLMITLFVGAFAWMISSIFNMFDSHPANQIAIESIRSNPEIEAAIGEIESFDRSTGNISGGNANLSIVARGVYGDVRVTIELEMRDGGDWEIIRFNFVQIRQGQSLPSSLRV